MPNQTRPHTWSEQFRWAFFSPFFCPYSWLLFWHVCVCVIAGQHCSSANAWLIPRMVITYVSSLHYCQMESCDNGQGFSKGDLTNSQHILQGWAEPDRCWQAQTFDWELEVKTANIKVHCALTHSSSKPAAGGMGRKHWLDNGIFVISFKWLNVNSRLRACVNPRMK